MWGLFQKGWPFGLRFLVSLLSKERIWLKKFSKNGQFLVYVPRDINQGDFRVSLSWDFILLVEKVRQVWNYSKSWFIPNYQISVFFFKKKLIIFCCLIFEEFEKSFWIRNFKANCLSRRDQKVYSIFQNCAPRGTKVFNRFQSGRKYLSRWVYYQQ